MTQLRDYQVEDLAFYMAHPRCGNLSDPGTGKTPSVCVYFGWLWKEKGVRTIWAMPKSLLRKNREELLIWSGLEPDDVTIVDGPPAKRDQQMRTDAKVFLMGFRCFADNWEHLVGLHPDIDCLGVDEWHLGFKGDSSQRTQSMYRFMDRTTYLVAMTGTLIDGRLDAAYPFIRLVEPGEYRDYNHFYYYHAVENDFGHVCAWIRPERVSKVLQKHTVRHTFAEVYGPEAKIIQHDVCEMDPRQREAYSEFEASALLELEDDWLDGSLPGVNQIRCRQLMEHPQSFGPPLDAIPTTGKEERLLIHLEDHKARGEPLVIFSALVPQHDRLKDLCRKVGLKAEIIDGRVSAKERGRIDEAFRSGQIDVVIASAATAGIGFNWGHVNHVIFASLDPMDSNFVQAYRRAIRGVRKTPLLITVMSYENSIDSRLFDIVNRKSKLANTVDETTELVHLNPAPVAPPANGGRGKRSRTLPPVSFTMVGLISGK